MSQTVHVVLSVFDGARHLPDQIRSVQRQTHPEWRLHVRDDGSRDGSGDVARALASEDDRIRVLPDDGRRLGSGRSFGLLLESLPDDDARVACCDADDVWLPDRLERSLRAMRSAEDEVGPSTPVLVHGDLVVVGAGLEVLHASFWERYGLDPEPATVRRMVVQNVVTGPTMLMNAPLRRRVVPVPEEAIHQDWWIGLVAAATGVIRAMDEATVLYRQHEGNTVGAAGGASGVLGRIPGAWGRRDRLRESLAATGRQARALLERFSEELSPEERRFIQEYSEIPECGFLRRKWRVLRLRTLREHGLLRNLGVVVRA